MINKIANLQFMPRKQQTHNRNSQPSFGLLSREISADLPETRSYLETLNSMLGSLLGKRNVVKSSQVDEMHDLYLADEGNFSFVIGGHPRFPFQTLSVRHTSDTRTALNITPEGMDETTKTLFKEILDKIQGKQQ